MKFFRTLCALTAISAVFPVPSAWSATYQQHDSQHPAATPALQVAQAQPGTPASGMGNRKGMEAQMKMMMDRTQTVPATKWGDDDEPRIPRHRGHHESQTRHRTAKAIRVGGMVFYVRRRPGKERRR